MKRSGYRDSDKTKPIPKMTATRNGKAINQTVANVDAEEVLAQPEPDLTLLKWLNNWPKEPPKWAEVGENHYKLTLDNVRMEVFSQQKDHSKRPIFGFSLFGVFGNLHTVPLLSFSLKETQQAAIASIDWINNGSKDKAPYTIDPAFVTEEQEPRPRPRPVRPPPRPMPGDEELPRGALPPADHPVVDPRIGGEHPAVILPAIEPRPDGHGTAPHQIMGWFNEFFQTDVLRPGDDDDYPDYDDDIMEEEEEDDA